jgi:malonyl-CoA O-methyltransferase
MINYRLYRNRITRYCEASFIEKEINKRLVDRLEFIHTSPNQILDLGCGFGYGLSLLRDRFPNSNRYGLDFNDSAIKYIAERQLSHKKLSIKADFNQQLPYKENSFDLVMANLSLQGSENIYSLIEKIYFILKPNGILLFSLLAEDTLSEFRLAWSEVDSYKHHNPFISAKAMSGILQSSQFTDTVIDCENIVLKYGSPKDAILDIKAINEPLSLQSMRKTLTGKNRWVQFIKNWEAQRLVSDNKIQNTYHVMYGYACKNNVSKLKVENNDIKVNIKDIMSIQKKRV